MNYDTTIQEVERDLCVGSWFVDKYKKRIEEGASHYTVALQLKKQGVPLDIARAILFGIITWNSPTPPSPSSSPSSPS